MHALIVHGIVQIYFYMDEIFCAQNGFVFIDIETETDAYSKVPLYIVDHVEQFCVQTHLV